MVQNLKSICLDHSKVTFKIFERWIWTSLSAAEMNTNLEFFGASLADEAECWMLNETASGPGRPESEYGPTPPGGPPVPL